MTTTALGGPSTADQPDSSAALTGEVIGAHRRRVMPAPIKIVQGITGYLLLRWLVGLIVRHLLGYRVETRAEWDGQRLHLATRARLLGRELRSSEEVILASDMVSVGVERRFPHLLLLLGFLGTLLGAMYGVGWVVDGIQASYSGIALFGLGALAAGVLLDLALSTLAGYIGARASLLVSIRSAHRFSVGRHYRIVGVDEDAARAFVELVLGPEQVRALGARPVEPSSC